MPDCLTSKIYTELCSDNICQPSYILKRHFHRLRFNLSPPQAASPTDDESTMTFHDALSDEEDVLIADLEMDDEEDDRRHRKSDIVDLDSVSLS